MNRKKRLEELGYRLVGKHSAIKVCLWCKQAIRGVNTCYKHKFYGIDSWRCIQSSVSLDACTLRCNWCWRDVKYSQTEIKNPDKPKFILDGLIKEQREILMGFFGSKTADKKRLNEAMEPKHVALSLTGETCLYPLLPELIKEIHSRGMTSFVVSNGTVPSMVKKLTKQQPTQFYITLPSPTKELFKKSCNPLIDVAWDNIQESLGLLGKFDRGTIRMTLAKDMNMLYPEKYAELLKGVDFKFLELKAAMPVGFAKYKMRYEQMPLHSEIKDFAEKICKQNGWKIIDEKKESRVVLVMKDDVERKIKF